MKKVLILGAGKSSGALIDYLVEHASALNIEVVVADLSVELAQQKTSNRERTASVAIDLKNETATEALIASSELVISMLPAMLHATVAKLCLQQRKNLLTPSYISPAMQQMQGEVEKHKLLFLNELGLDPGIDHMSAMQLISRLKSDGACITAFESHCGGLVAQESDTNPWHYKFSWNPRNVVLAGQGEGSIRYLHRGAVKVIPYFRLFENTTELTVPGFGTFESYPNRDSLKYISAYGLQEVESMYRGTLRVPPFCSGWQLLVQLGICDDSTPLEFPDHFTYRQFLESFLPARSNTWTTSEIATLLHTTTSSKAFQLLEATGLLSNTPIGVHRGTPARVLQQLLEEKWQMKTGDRDLVVMVHRVDYLLNGKKHRLQSSFALEGSSTETAMATTVGLPLAIAAKLLLSGKLNFHGVLMPTLPGIYNPIMQELEQKGIAFEESFVA